MSIDSFQSYYCLNYIISFNNQGIFQYIFNLIWRLGAYSINLNTFSYQIVYKAKKKPMPIDSLQYN